MKKLLIVSALLMCITGCTKIEKSSSEVTAEPPIETAVAEATGFDQTVVVAGFELTFGSEATIELIENQYSTHHGKEVVAIPVHLKNKSGESGSFNMFLYKSYGPSGSEQEKLAIAVNKEDALGMDGDLRDQAEKESKLYLQYEGDGDYFIEFNDFKVKQEVKFEIKK